jgi:hypothetical protein
MAKKVNLEFLRDVDEIFNEVGVSYFILGGVCLSIIRNNSTRGMLYPDNQDLDIGMISTDHVYREKILNALREKGYYIKIYHSGIFGLYAIKTIGEVDDPENEVRILDIHYLYRYENFRWKRLGDSFAVYDDFLFDIEKIVEFRGLSLSVPNPPEEYLKQEYGEDWIKPCGLPIEQYPSYIRGSSIGLRDKIIYSLNSLF